MHEKLILHDSLRSIELYGAKGSPHAGSLLIVYLPAERILIEADLENADIAANIERLGLKVETVLGLHNRPMQWPPK